MSLSDLTWRPPLVAATPARALVADLVALTKPRIVELLVVTGVAATVVAAGGWPGAGPLAAVIIGGGMAGAGAGSINCALEGDLDRKMPRTSQRPVAAGRLSAGVALTQGIVLNLAAFTLIEMLTNPLAAGLTLAGTLWYVFIYTLWLKPRTTSNIVVGGLAGSFPPLVGWAAVTGTIATTPIALAAVIFFWTPPHFWALATLANDEYRAAGVPMLPAVAGSRRTARAMLAYGSGVLAASVVPFAVGDLGFLYLAVALTAGGWFLGACARHLRRLEPVTARRVFLGSLAYMAAVFMAAPLDVLVR
ncbi:MAG TPA: heme o synthase [Acidimicrobiia bacterium]|nr:heme o synthase [Acidimicrobiia bacterium]